MVLEDHLASFRFQGPHTTEAWSQDGCGVPVICQLAILLVILRSKTSFNQFIGNKLQGLAYSSDVGPTSLSTRTGQSATRM